MTTIEARLERCRDCPDRVPHARYRTRMRCRELWRPGDFNPAFCCEIAFCPLDKPTPQVTGKERTNDHD